MIAPYERRGKEMDNNKLLKDTINYAYCNLKITGAQRDRLFEFLSQKDRDLSKWEASAKRVSESCGEANELYLAVAAERDELLTQRTKILNALISMGSSTELSALRYLESFGFTPVEAEALVRSVK